MDPEISVSSLKNVKYKHRPTIYEYFLQDYVCGFGSFTANNEEIYSRLPRIMVNNLTTQMSTYCPIMSCDQGGRQYVCVTNVHNGTVDLWKIVHDWTV